MNRGVTVVRPYGDRIRRRVFGHIKRAGLRIDSSHVVPTDATDDEAVQLVQRFNDPVLLVPYHARRNRSGSMTDGLEFLRILVARVGALTQRVLMPVSRFGAAGLELALMREELPREAVLIITEDELGDLALALRIRDHVKR